MAKQVWSVGAIGGLAIVTMLTVTAPMASAQFTGTIASDKPAGFIVFPKIVVDTTGLFNPAPTDTIVQITNTSLVERYAECFYVNAASHCSNLPALGCQTASDCPVGGTCDPGWLETDFTLDLTPNQPQAWQVSDGNAPSGPVPPVDSYFVGELKCVEVDAPATVTPINANDLKGEATIVTASNGPGGNVDSRAYSAIGIQTVVNDGTTQAEPPGEMAMCLGGSANDPECPTAEYASCPSVLILDHPFDQLGFSPYPAYTDLTLVPCSETLANGVPQTTTTVQFLVFNEFEQRFSTSTVLNCFKETPLSSIDSPRDPRYSIFSVGVQGTLVGQTRIHGVSGTETDTGHGLLGLAEWYVVSPTGVHSSAYHLSYSGSNAQPDIVRFYGP